MKTRIFLFLVFIPFHAFCSESGWNSTDVTMVKAENLYRFSRVYGCIRYFYPDQELQSFDWNRFVMYGVNRILVSNDSKASTTLMDLFSPLCPEIRFDTDSLPDDNNTIEPPFYIQEHRAIGQLALMDDAKYSPLKKVEAKDALTRYPRMFCLKLAEHLYLKFPLVEKSFQPQTAAFKHLESEVGKMEVVGFTLKDALSKRKRSQKAVLYKRYDYRIADMIIRQQLVFNFYPYFEEDNLSNIWEGICKQSYVDIARCGNVRNYYDLICRFLAHVRDSHIMVWSGLNVGAIGSFIPVYYPAVDVRFSADTCYINTSDSKDLVKMSPGDIVLSVNGVSINDVVATKLKNYSASTRASALEKLSGCFLFESYKKDSLIALQLKNRNGQTYAATITTSLPEPFYPAQRRWLEAFRDSIVYVNLCTDSANYKNFSSRIAMLQKANGIIFDLRGYPHPDVLSILSHFIKDTVFVGNLKVPVRSFPERQNIRYAEIDRWGIAPATSGLSNDFARKYEYKQPLAESINVPLVFLTDARAQSFAETVLEMVKQYRIGTIVGEPTAGCNGDATKIDMLFATFFLTYNKFMNRDGSLHHGVGVIPDVYSTQAVSDVFQGVDTQLEKAKSLLRRF